MSAGLSVLVAPPRASRGAMRSGQDAPLPAPSPSPSAPSKLKEVWGSGWATGAFALLAAVFAFKVYWTKGCRRLFADCLERRCPR